MDPIKMRMTIMFLTTLPEEKDLFYLVRVKRENFYF